MASRPDKPHGCALRRGRYSAANNVYLVTCVTHCRIRALEELGSGRCLVRALRFQQTERRADTLAYVVMPDHLHWLLQLCRGATLSGVMHSVKTFSGRAINRLQGRRGRLWQSGYHDHAVRRDEDLVAMARYVVANPLRAGLVAGIGQYPLWDAAWLRY